MCRVVIPVCKHRDDCTQWCDLNSDSPALSHRNAFSMGGDLNARNPTQYIFSLAVGSIDTPLEKVVCILRLCFCFCGVAHIFGVVSGESRNGDEPKVGDRSSST